MVPNRGLAWRSSLRLSVAEVLGADYFDQRRPEATAKRLTRRLEKLGYQVTLQPTAASPT